MSEDYNALAECFRNVYKSDTGVNPRGEWTEAQMQAYLDSRPSFEGDADLDEGDVDAVESAYEDRLSEDEGDELDYEHDGQPDEAQEWHDFDPDC